MPIFHINVFRTPIGTVYISLIKIEANEVAPNRGTKVDVQPLG